MSLRDIILGFPQAAYLLILLIPALVLQVSLFLYRRKQLSSFAYKAILPKLLTPRSHLFTICKIAASMLILVLICLSLMDPQGNLHYLPSSAASKESQPLNFAKRYRPHEVVLLIDTSASMSVIDTPQGQTRLDQAKDIMDGVVANLSGQTVSLYTFTSVLTPLVPQTNDYLFTRLMIRGLTINQGDIGGTNFTKSLTQLKEKIFSSPEQKLYTLILFSDGGDQEVELTQGAAKKKVIAHILNILPNPNDFHFRLYTVGVGSETPSVVPHVAYEGKPVYSKIEPLLLEQLAKRNNGIYYSAHLWTDWELAQELKKQIIDMTLAQQTEPVDSLERKVSTAKQEDMLSDLYYQIPLGLAIILLLTYLILPDVRRS